MKLDTTDITLKRQADLGYRVTKTGFDYGQGAITGTTRNTIEYSYAVTYRGRVIGVVTRKKDVGDLIATHQRSKR